mgnify:CR=1 FL=1
MKQSIRSKHSFFESMKQAKEEFNALTEIHPELAELSPREIEVFDQLLSDKTLAKIAEDMGAPALPSSGRQEYLQGVLNEILFR